MPRLRVRIVVLLVAVACLVVPVVRYAQDARTNRVTVINRSRGPIRDVGLVDPWYRSTIARVDQGATARSSVRLDRGLDLRVTFRDAAGKPCEALTSTDFKPSVPPENVLEINVIIYEDYVNIVYEFGKPRPTLRELVRGHLRL